MTSRMRITYCRSGIGSSLSHRRTLRALGLRTLGQSVTHVDRPSLRGMLRKVAHLVKVEVLTESVSESPGPAGAGQPPREAPVKTADLVAPAKLPAKARAPRTVGDTAAAAPAAEKRPARTRASRPTAEVPATDEAPPPKRGSRAKAGGPGKQSPKEAEPLKGKRPASGEARDGSTVRKRRAKPAEDAPGGVTGGQDT